MSVSLEEALNGAGYRFDNIEDCEWLLGKVDEFDELIEKAQDLKDKYDEQDLKNKYDDYLDCKETAEDDGDYNYPSFREWLELKGEK